MSRDTAAASVRRKNLPKGTRQNLAEAAVRAVKQRERAFAQAEHEHQEGDISWADISPVIETIVPAKQDTAKADWIEITRDLRSQGKPRFGFGNVWALYVDEHEETVDKLLRKMQELQDEVKRHQSQITGLQKDVEKTSPLVALLESNTKIEEAPELAWCTSHIDLLKQHAPAFLAIDVPQSKIVVVAKTQEEFVANLQEIGPEKVKGLYRIHTSMFV